MMFRVATYNVRKCVGLDRRRRPERVLGVLEEIGADVVALQEVDRRFGTRASTLPATALAEAGWRAAAPQLKPASLGWHGNAILAGPDVAIESAWAIPLPALEPRGAVAVDLSVRGFALTVVGMHLGLTAGPRARQVATILAHLEERESRPTVLMGDTNEWRAIAGALAGFARAHRLSDPLPTFHTSLPLAALDRIATTRDLGFRACGVHRSRSSRTASDHLPLWADIAPAGDV